MLKNHCCTEPTCSTNQRNRYFQGKRLTPASLETEQAYANLRRRLINQSLFGTGVVAGFQVAPADNLVVGSGFAIDVLGRELIQLDACELELRRLLVIDSAGKLKTDNCGMPTQDGIKDGSQWLLSAHYAEEKTGERSVTSACSCNRTEWDYICETIRYSITPWHEGSSEFDCGLKCRCDLGDSEHSEASKSRSAYCIDRHIGERSLPGATRLTDVFEACGTVAVDLSNGVALARITVTLAPNDRIQLTSSMTCGVRKLVKHNELLFDLIRGCDLTHIRSLGWTWPRDIQFSDFASMFPIAPDSSECVTKFSVQFDREVQSGILSPEAIAIRVYFVEGFDRWLEGYRVPVRELRVTDANTISAIVDKDWVDDALLRNSKFDKCDALVEIEVRGDLIADCVGQAVDANGTGSPGGTLLKTHLIKSKNKQTA